MLAPKEYKFQINSIDIKSYCSITALLGLGLAALAGCNRGPEMAVVQGVVYYNNQPLPFGSVMFQPERGQPAVGQVQTDGSFEMSSFSPGDGATVGPQKVRINCYSSQSPNEKAKPVVGEKSIGVLLIPRQYTSFGTSGLTVDVKPDENEVFEFHLVGPQKKFPK